MGGIDTYNIDDLSGKKRPVHSVLLGSDILIVEQMSNLELIPSENFKFYAALVKVKGFNTFPVRAFSGNSSITRPSCDANKRRAL